ncbi:helix-turn-helix domain-containing protein [Mucilaginibacter sp. RS28]|uniref:Helix-turn-helix domain-containing protein n=1 Tax=Mucilaginibacter straminoryzae TaxID=2932774 RepID=A0A9X2BB51_9SPHI|nr:helix-turn-helix domain-containing protein [Mucilaginibacter straminoryzae]MCJ8212056.1 helix-turn-helix domain-containing protein [Mucilaginibacter straminoryzae]
MAVEVITKEDLEAFGEKLLNQMKALLGQGQDDSRKFLKTYQVKNLLKISNNTLQLLRDNGTIPFTKIGGIFYYSQEDILKVLKGESQNKTLKFSR